MPTRKILIMIVAAVAVLGAACASGTAVTTTTSTTTTVPIEIPDLEFGRGEVPFTVPATFPLPSAAVIGSTMIDGVNGRTEMIITFPSDVTSVVTFYEANLPVLGFAVASSTGTDSGWEIVFDKDGTSGTIILSFGGAGVSAGTISFDHNS